MDAFGDGRAEDAVLEYLWAGGSCRLLVFARCDIAAILRRKNMLALQVFGGVNVAGFFPLILLACAFLPCGICNGVLV